MSCFLRLQILSDKFIYLLSNSEVLNIVCNFINKRIVKGYTDFSLHANILSVIFYSILRTYQHIRWMPYEYFLLQSSLFCRVSLFYMPLAMVLSLYICWINFDSTWLDLRYILDTKRLLFCSIYFSIEAYEPGHEKMCIMQYAKNKGADQPAHLRSLISAFVVRCQDRMIPLVYISEISRF